MILTLVGKRERERERERGLQSNGWQKETFGFLGKTCNYGFD